MLQLAESHKAAAERQMKHADGVRHAPIGSGSVDEFPRAPRAVVVQEAQTKRRRVN